MTRQVLRQRGEADKKKESKATKTNHTDYSRTPLYLVFIIAHTKNEKENLIDHLNCVIAGFPVRCKAIHSQSRDYNWFGGRRGWLPGGDA